MISRELDNVSVYKYKGYDECSNEITHSDEMINIIHSIDPSIKIDLYVITDEKGDIDNRLLAQALSDIKDRKYDVINMSFYTKENHNITRTIDDIYNDGSLIVASAGNLGDWIVSYPASLHNVLCIGGITKDSNIWSDSNRGNIDYVMPVSFYSNISNKDLEGTSISAVLFSAFSIKALQMNPDFNREDLINYINKKSVNPNEREILGRGQPCFNINNTN